MSISEKDMHGSEVDIFTKESCIEVATDDTGWVILYRVKGVEEYWVKTYPDSECHGSGEPLLTKITINDAKAKFGV